MASQQKLCRLWHCACVMVAMGAAAVGAGAEETSGWQQFRKSYPYHIQGVKLVGPQSDGTQELIIAEPPPHVTVDGLKQVVGDELRTLEVKQHPIGHDGWVRDAVLRVVSPNEQDFPELLARLHKYLFDTTYKSYLIGETAPASKEPASKAQLNLNVAAPELVDWLVDKQVPLIPLLDVDEPAGSLLKLFEEQARGVFVTAELGVVVWIVPRDERLEGYRADARRFALDSDLILGAIAEENSVAILARERVADVVTLPPLRAETIFLLAAMSEGELHQSYARNSLFAGKLKDLRDAAPIELSDELVDTEFGSLLNIADQVLKSWTEHGQVKYENFPYPDPPRFPFEDRLSKVLKASQLLFNWNTRGAGYVVSDAARKLDVMAFNRTGSLPVTYLPEPIPVGAAGGEVQRAEETAYSYFASIGDPCLARVHQYAALYTIFYHCDVSAEVPVNAGAGEEDLVEAQQGVLLEEATKLIRSIQAADDKQIAEWIARYRAMLRAAGATDQQIGGTDEVQELMVKVREKIREQMKDAEAEDYELAAAMMLVFPDRAKGLASLFANRDQVFNRLSEASAKAAGDSWIHTGAVVVSHNAGEGGALLTGGHNVNSAVTRFRSTTEVPAGAPRVVVEGEELVVLHNPADAPKTRLAVREASVYRGVDELPQLQNVVRRVFAETKPPPIRPQKEAVAFVARNSAGHRGIGQGHLPQGPAPRFGWDGPPKPPGGGKGAALSDAFPDPARPNITVARETDGSFEVIFDGPKGRKAYFANTTTDAADIAEQLVRAHGGEPPPRLLTDGLSEKQVDGFLLTMEMRQGSARSRISLEPGAGMTVQKFKQAASRTYAWREAKVKPIDVQYKHGRTLLTFEVDVPPVGRVAGNGLRFRIRAWIEGIVDAAGIKNLREKIFSIFRHDAGETTTANEAIDLLDARMREYFSAEDTPAYWRAHVVLEEANLTGARGPLHPGEDRRAAS